ncbi:Toxin RTX-I translocation ATP-binding protein [Neolewinella maritima]|uniref:Toxin RTX-I translocation ATP-binding protein n=1 Tax=Neolewinella maritima TaxID=1383882 RepID=A0ABN8F881_9BACT|nr:peptidase domain-containing ABC transporter [Neolewinella maritima]CAH1000369.1 Toxin RTX-I translocation ATP-binding protein [Neolewinella maritima]
MRGHTYYQQFEEMDCGAACLRMVAKYHGREFGLEQLRERTRISREGASLLGISEGAESIGLQTLALTVGLPQLEQEVPLPCILPWREDHFVVLEDVTAGNFTLADPDPSVGRVTLGRLAFLEGWSHGLTDAGTFAGRALVLEPTPRFSAPSDEPSSPGSLRYVWQYIRQYRSLTLNLGLGLVLALVLSVIFPFLLRNLIDQGIVLNDPNLIVLIVVAQGVLLLTMTILTALRRYVLVHVGGRITISLVSDYLTKLVRLPMAFYDSRSRGDLFQRLQDHRRVEEFLTGGSLPRVFSLVSFLAFATVLLLWNATIFALFFVGTLLQFAWVIYMQGRKQQLDRTHFEQSADNSELLMEIIDGMAEIKQHNAGQQRRWAWERQRAALYQTTVALNKLEQYQRTVGSLVNQAKNLCITLLAAMLVLRGELSIGSLVAIHYILAQLSSPIDELGELVTAYQENKVGLERIQEIHLKADEQTSDADKLRVIPEGGQIVLDGISFRYRVPNAPAVLHQLSARLPVGKVTALVGASGSGKSTLLKLLIGFYPPGEGEIRVGGTSLASLDRTFWRETVGMVSQDGYLFSDSIARNIVLGDDRIDQERLLEVAKVAQIDRFVEGLPQGYATKIGASGVGLSQGQQQRILLARAIYRKPRYLFLDEATTALDAFTEVTLMDSLLTYMAGATILLVTHRHTVFEQADHILVLEGGRIIERGTHHDLMQDGSAYYQLVRNQTSLGR